MTRFVGWLLGLNNVTAIDEMEADLAAPWAQEGAFWVFAAAVLAGVAGFVFYLRWQPKGSLAARLVLASMRGLLLALLVLTLADPVLRLTVVHEQRPLLYLIVDGTDSMAIADELPPAERERLATAVGEQVGRASQPVDQRSEVGGPKSAELRSRMEYVQSLLKKKDNNLLARLQDEKRVQIEPFVFDGNSTSQLRKLAAGADGRVDSAQLADQLTTTGQVTALGSVLSAVGQQFGSGRLAGVVLVSDFAHNSGVAPLGSSENSPVAKLGVPIYAVGVGMTEAVDLAVDLQTDPKMKKAERSSILVKLRQSGLQGQSVRVTLVARPLAADSMGAPQAETKVGEKSVTLQSAVETIDFPFTPEESGRFEFTASVEKVAGEIVDQNNRASREVNIIDDYLRLLYVAYEPTWEWRFIKEVFHRDKLVGMDGFRTFLASSDPRVRESNVLFVSSLTPKRSEFFANDVIFLDDMPRSALTDRFSQMLKEYVSNLGGGLVVIAGPRFGPKELYQTPLADMLPVTIDPNAELRDTPRHPEFRPRLTLHAARYPFMQLGAGDVENSRAWDNLGKLPWYQPVAALHEQAFALAEHPTDKCADGKTPQPLIAVRQYGKGQVVYLGFNETWRLRRRYGEKYYRQFWSQLIYHLGMSHALGGDKRFVARIDAQEYRAEDKVLLTVEAYDENYEPLGAETLADGALTAELVKPNGDLTPLSVPMLRRGVFELRVPVFAAGQYSLRVKDPITGKSEEQPFEVLPLSAERRRGVRDEKLQKDLAQRTGGKAYDLTNVDQLLSDLDVKPLLERQTRNHGLWTTPLWFGLVVALMLGEWLGRKMIRLS
jgi:hypothetical protein